jgi:hypothetical protein
LDKYGRVVDKTPEAWKLLFGDSDKPTTINEVAAKVGVSAKKDDAPAAEAGDSDAEKAAKKAKKREKKEAEKAE